MNNENKDIILKSWEVYQNLIKSMSDSMWKIKSIYFTIITTFITYAYVNNITFLYLVLIVISILFFLLESWYKILEFKFMKKSHAIETTLEDIIVDEENPRFPDSLKTSTESITFKQLFDLLAIKRIIFWLPYFIIISLCGSMWYFNLKAENNTHTKKEYIYSPPNTYYFNFKDENNTPTKKEYIYTHPNIYDFYFKENSIILNKKDIIRNELLLNAIKNVNTTYIIQIRGHASLKNVKNKTSFSDNYQLSNARCIRLKDYILDFFDEKNIHRNKIIIEIYPYSNQYATNEDDSLNRKATITIQEYRKK